MDPWWDFFFSQNHYYVQPSPCNYVKIKDKLSLAVRKGFAAHHQPHTSSLMPYDGAFTICWANNKRHICIDLRMTLVMSC